MWRKSTGYAGTAPVTSRDTDKYPHPPIALIELDDAAREPPMAMRISELRLFELLTGQVGDAAPAAVAAERAFIDAQALVALCTYVASGDDAPGADVRSGARVLCVVTTPARDPRRTRVRREQRDERRADIARAAGHQDRVGRHVCSISAQPPRIAV